MHAGCLGQCPAIAATDHLRVPTSVQSARKRGDRTTHVVADCVIDRSETAEILQVLPQCAFLLVTSNDPESPGFITAPVDLGTGTGWCNRAPRHDADRDRYPRANRVSRYSISVAAQPIPSCKPDRCRTSSTSTEASAGTCRAVKRGRSFGLGILLSPSTRERLHKTLVRPTGWKENGRRPASESCAAGATKG